MRAQLQVIKGYFAGIHRVRRLLVALIALVVSDGVITHFLISNGLGWEANPFLRPLVGGGNFLVLKVVVCKSNMKALKFCLSRHPHLWAENLLGVRWEIASQLAWVV